MRATGIIRKIDDLGRIVIPKEIRNGMGFKEGEQLEIFVNEDSIIFKKYNSVSLWDVAYQIAQKILPAAQIALQNTRGITEAGSVGESYNLCTIGDYGYILSTANREEVETTADVLKIYFENKS